MMTDEQVAGREFDALVAERCLSWTKVYRNDYGWVGLPPGHESFAGIPSFSENREAAMTLLDTWDGEIVWYRAFGQHKIELFLPDNERVYAQAWDDTFPMAICKAMLAAKEER